MLKLFIPLIIGLVQCGFYGSNDKVVNLDSSNFSEKVLKSDGLWYIEFYAPWCGHCKQLTPAWKEAAQQMHGLVNFGAVNADEQSNQPLASKYGIQGFPTIKIFSKGKVSDYQGARSAQALTSHAFESLKNFRTGGGSSGGSNQQQRSSGGSGGSGNAKDVTVLTDSNFDSTVINGEAEWIVEFYAPWCGHCQRLEPEYNKAASKVAAQMQGKVKLGKVDCTVEKSTCGRFGVQGYPTLKVFGSDKHNPTDYNGSRDESGLFAQAESLFENLREPAELRELNSQITFEEKCNNEQLSSLCVVAVLPHILDDQAEGRNKRLDLIKQMIESYKSKRSWEWFWMEAASQPEMETALGVGGFGYPALAAINTKKKIRSTMTAAFTKDGINDFLRTLAAGRAGRNYDSFMELPPVSETTPWDGKDAVQESVDEYDLSDFDWDDDDKDEL